MKLLLNFILASALCLFTSPLEGFDLLILQSGEKIEGKIVKEGDESLWLDLGVDVIQFPRHKIQSILKDGVRDKVKNPPENSIDEAENPHHLINEIKGLYQIGDKNSPLKEIDQQVPHLEDSVVKVSTPGGLGSGFFIHRDGYLLTNYHVIEGETRIRVTMYKKYKKDKKLKNILNEGDDRVEQIHFENVEIKAFNPFFDLALLKIQQPDEKKKHLVFQPLPLASPGTVENGQKVFAIGNPYGLERTVSQGIISLKNRQYGGLIYLQTTTPINPGNSGGPLFNLRGQVVGVTNMTFMNSDGLGFAIPNQYLVEFLDNLEAFAFDRENSVKGFHYFSPPGKKSL